MEASRRQVVAARVRAPADVRSAHAAVAAAGARAAARQLAEATPDRRRLGLARSIVAQAMAKVWRTAATGTSRRLRDPWCDVDAVDARHAPVAESLGDVAASMSIERAAFLLGGAYASMLPSEYRSEHGVFYTPPDLAARLLDRATAAGVDWKRCTVLDPACGGGAFLTPVAARMIAARAHEPAGTIVQHLRTRLRGYELDPFAAWISQCCLDALLLSHVGAAFERLDLVEVCDSVSKVDRGAEYDLVVGNPPYGRTKLDAPRRATFARSLYGHANQYTIFLDLAIRWTRAKGVIAFVTPTSFLSGEYFKQLRALLAKEAPPVTFDFVEERDGVFDDVLQETVLSVSKRGAKLGPVRVSHVRAAGDAIKTTEAGTFPLPAEPSEPWMLPRRPDLSDVARLLTRATTRLRDWGYAVSTGPLVWNRHKTQLRQTATASAVPLVWAESVTPDGLFEFRAARRNHAPYFVPGAADEWLLVRAPCVLLQRTTATEQPRRLIAAELPKSFIDDSGGAVTVENHLNMIVPIVARPAISPATVAAFLNSTIADRAFRCINGSVAVSAFELEAMPLPSLDAMRAITAAAREAGRERVDQVAASLYAT